MLRSLCLAGLTALALVSAPVLGARAPPDLKPDLNWAYVQMQMIEISNIDGVAQAFHADFYMLTTWAAPLAGTAYNGTEDLTTSGLADNFWAPQLEFVNSREQVTTLVDEPYSFTVKPSFEVTDIRPDYVLPAGWAWIVEDQRYQCDFTTPLSMEDFPFDTQFMQLVIESLWTSSEVNIAWADPPRITGLIPNGLDIVGWDFLRSRQFNQIANYAYNDENYSRLTIRTLLRRQPNYYMTKIVAGAMLLVYMCIWVFSLAVDEADRMMGTLQIFAGLITYLFVASGDTPKVPYQTRLDLFMLWCFFNVAFMLVIHGSLYYWRECDIEDHLEEKEKEKELHKDKLYEEARNIAEIELAVASRVYVNEQPAEHGMASVHPNAAAGGRTPTMWRLRKDPWATFTLRKWYAGLHYTRQWDAIVIPVEACIYSIGCAVILGRAVTTVSA